MKNIISMKLFRRLAFITALPLCFGLGSCKQDIDESNLYSFTGETILSYLKKDTANFSTFLYILEKAKVDKLMASYGQYTCFAPNNSAIKEYLEECYKNGDVGFTSSDLKSLEESARDSICNDIAKYHIVNSELLTVDMNENVTIQTMLGRDLSTSIDSLSGSTVINLRSKITGADNEVENGVVQVIDNVLRRSNRLVFGELETHNGYKLFRELLDATGLSDSLTKQSKTFTSPSTTYFYVPSVCYMGYTLFMETDSVFKQNGITTVEQMAAKANELYGGCAGSDGWYDYARNNGIEISTGTDYKNQWNCLNMFVRYHILKQKVPYSNLVWSPNNTNSSVQPYEYYETMLPYTLMKVERIAGNTLSVNRYKAHNTVTDDPIRQGSAAIHSIMNQGIGIDKNGSFSAVNGYMHSIDGLLAYTEYVPHGVLNERMRFDDASLMWELNNNSLRQVQGSVIKALNGGKEGKHSGSSLGGNYVQIPDGFFDNMKVYNGENTMVFYLPGMENNWSNYQKDEFNCIGVYDFAFRLPPVPDGTYELRVGYTANNLRGMVQFYLGRSSSLEDLKALDIPLDMRLVGTNANIGWVDWTKEEDYGVATDKSMHNRGYMRGPLAYYTGSTLARANVQDLRRIITVQQFEQGEYWLRFKSVLPDQSNTQFHLDYIEFCPTSVYNNPTYPEDMF